MNNYLIIIRGPLSSSVVGIQEIKRNQSQTRACNLIIAAAQVTVHNASWLLQAALTYHTKPIPESNIFDLVITFGNTRITSAPLPTRLKNMS